LEQGGDERGGATFKFLRCVTSLHVKRRERWMKDKREKKDNVKKGCVFEESRALAREMKKLGDKD
jgi:hypothetical protein